MERFIAFHVFSFFEWISLITLGLVMFRHPIRTYRLNIGLISLLITVCSYVLRDILGIVRLAPFIQLGILIVFFIFIFRIRYLFAGLMASFGYLGYVNVQIALYYVMKSFSFFHEGSVLDSSVEVYLLVTLTVIVALTISVILNNFRIGFTYEPERDAKMTFMHKIFLYGFLLWSAILLISVMYMVESRFVQLFLVMAMFTIYIAFDFVMKREIAVLVESKSKIGRL